MDYWTYLPDDLKVKIMNINKESEKKEHKKNKLLHKEVLNELQGWLDEGYQWLDDGTYQLCIFSDLGFNHRQRGSARARRWAACDSIESI